MNQFKRMGAFLKSPRSDFFLCIVALLLLNLVGARAFVRLDLTSRQSFTLSEASRRVVSTLEEPLSVKVFFTANLPAPYNSVERYLEDLLVEYKGAAGRKLSFDFVDMEKDESRELATSYGIGTIQVQEVKNDEVGFKNAYMAMALVYSDSIEVIDNITSDSGLEYRVTTTIGRMVNTASALSGLDGQVKLTLYVSSALRSFRINGFAELEGYVREAFDRVNAKNRGKLSFARVDPASLVDVEQLATRYGLKVMTWTDRASGESGAGLLDIVVEYGDRFRTIPLQLQRNLFGGYTIGGLETLEQTIGDSLQGLLSNSQSIGYLTGHGELDLEDEQAGMARFAGLVSDMYAFRALDLTKDEIPADVSALMINGPKQEISEAELYKIDQFLLRGGNVIVLYDAFLEIQAAQQSYYGQEPAYMPVITGLEPLLEKYGVQTSNAYVLDEECFVARQEGVGEMPLYYAPMIERSRVEASSPISRNLAKIILLKASPLKVTLADGADRTALPLLRSSASSWALQDRVSLNPYMLSPPDKSTMQSYPLAVLVEGRFDSAFAAKPAAGEEAPADGLVQKDHLARSVQTGRLLVVGTSEITGGMLVDERGSEPVAVFARNALDYMAGNGELNDMRTKSLGIHPLNRTTSAARGFVKYFNIIFPPLLTAAAGAVVWFLRSRRRKAIQARYGKANAEEASA